MHRIHSGRQRPREAAADREWSLRCVADRFDVVAVGVADEGAEVARVVLGELPRFVQDLGADAQLVITGA